jgi:hypothetical protein
VPPLVDKQNRVGATPAELLLLLLLLLPARVSRRGYPLPSRRSLYGTSHFTTAGPTLAEDLLFPMTLLNS